MYWATFFTENPTVVTAIVGLGCIILGYFFGKWNAEQKRKLKVAQRWGLMARNVSEDVILPSLPKDKVVVFTADEANQFVASTRTDRLYPLYAVALSMGLRRGEVLALK
jgi:hypothetical protein